MVGRTNRLYGGVWGRLVGWWFGGVGKSSVWWRLVVHLGLYPLIYWRLWGVWWRLVAYLTPSLTLIESVAPN